MPRYVLDELVGEGGMAAVYRARALGESGFARVVAVKRLLPDLARDRALQERFIDEARIAGALRHPCIVGVTDFYEDQGVQHLVMEFVDGVSLETLCTRGRAGRFLSPPVVSRLVFDLARALAFAHREGVTHRDLSTCNVLVSKEGEVKLADFGLADAHKKLSKTDPGALAGKAPYLSPERRRGEAAQPSDDLYALGVVVSRLLDATDPRERSRPPGPMLQEIATALKRDRATRIPSAAALLEVLRMLERAGPDALAQLVCAPGPRPPAAPRKPLDVDELEDTTKSTAPGSRSPGADRSLVSTIPDADPLGARGDGPQRAPPAPRRTKRRVVVGAALAALALVAALYLVLS